MLGSKKEPEESSSDWLVVNQTGHLSTQAYGYNRLNQIMLGICEQYATLEHFFLQEASYSYEDGYKAKFTLNIFQQPQKTIALFDVVRHGGSHLYLPTLEQAFEYYMDKKQAAEFDADTIIVPVAETARMHFRLLVLRKDAIHYYDSKSPIITKSFGFFMATLEAADEAITETINTEPPSYKALARIGKKTVENYPKHVHPVLNICEQYFPDVPGYEFSLGDQAFYQCTDCGPHIADYVERIMTGQPLIAEKNMFDIRTRQTWAQVKDEMFDKEAEEEETVSLRNV